jgi:hypothetical protein
VNTVGAKAGRFLGKVGTPLPYDDRKDALEEDRQRLGLSRERREA